MLLPFREHLDFGPTPYDQLQAREGIPIVRGHVVSDVMELEGSLGKNGSRGLLSQSSQPTTNGRVRVKSGRAAKHCRSGIFSKRSSISLKGGAPPPCGKREPRRSLSSGDQVRSLLFR